jgi:hypothetical protein
MNSASALPSPAAAPSSALTARSHALPPEIAPVLAGAFRQLEPQLFVCDCFNRLSLVGFEQLGASQMSVVSGIALPASVAPINTLHVVNDLAESPMCLAVSSAADVLLYRFDGDAVHNVLTFAASGGAPVASPSTTYRQRDGVLFFAGVPEKIRCLSLSEARVVQTLEIPRDTPVTAMTTFGRQLFAGMSDGAVNCYDDRSGVTSLADIVQAGHGRRDPHVVAIGASAVRDELVVASGGVVRVYDTRKRGLLRTVDPPTSFTFASQPASGAAHADPAGSLASFAVAPAARMVDLALSQRLPLMATLHLDGNVSVTNLRGERILAGRGGAMSTGVRCRDGGQVSAPAASSMVGAAGSFGTARPAAASVVPTRITMHPLRPLLCVGREIITVGKDKRLS